MKFKPIKRPSYHLVQAAPPRPPSAKPSRVVRRPADVCPWCGAVESFKAYSTQRRNGKIYRYSVCLKCGNHVTREISLPKK